MIEYLLNQQARWLEHANHLLQGSVTGAYEDGEFRFYKFGALAGRYPREWTASAIRTWSPTLGEEGIHKHERH